MKKFVIYSISFLVVFFAGVFGMYFYMSKNPSIIKKVINTTEKKVSIDEKGISESVNKIYDSVVTVTTYKNSRAYSSGTGFVYQKNDNEAYILTNAHVISNADEVFVTFTNGTTEKATVKGSNTWSDIAVLTIDASKVLVVAEVGSSADAKLGDTVFTVGAPLGDSYSWSVTRGILSGKDRLVEVSTSNSSYRNDDTLMMNVLQTDAAINSGNSGGPLANSNGEVIGITSMKLKETGVEGMGFAIPIETAIKYAKKIVNNETIEVPYVGASLITLNEAYYYSEFRQTILDSKQESGVIIASVESSSPAKKASLKSGDIITKVDGKKCPSLAYFRYYLYNHDPGDTIKLTYYRDGSEHTASIKLDSKNG